MTGGLEKCSQRWRWAWTWVDCKDRDMRSRGGWEQKEAGTMSRGNTGNREAWRQERHVLREQEVTPGNPHGQVCLQMIKQSKRTDNKITVA